MSRFELKWICSADLGNAAKSSVRRFEAYSWKWPLAKHNKGKEENVADWKRKPLHSQFLRKTEGETSNLSWTWLKEGEFYETDQCHSFVQRCQVKPHNSYRNSNNNYFYNTNVFINLIKIYIKRQWWRVGY